VRALVRPVKKPPTSTKLKVEKVTGDILDAAAIEAALKGCDTLYHLARRLRHLDPRRQNNLRREREGDGDRSGGREKSGT